MAGAQANIRTFIAPLRGPGRIAPTLLEDLTLYDPHYIPEHRRHLLNDPPVNFGGIECLHEALPKQSCRHAFYIQPRQTISPALDERPSQTSVYEVKAFCRLCRIHLLLRVDYSRNWKGAPCPNESRPVHHLIHAQYNQDLARSQWAREHPTSTSEIYVFECSSQTCGVLVTVYLSPSLLGEDDVHTLTDMDLLTQRTSDAFAMRKGDVEGMKRPSPTDVLVDLRAYFRNCWRKDARSDIALDNKRFVVRFGPNGEPCKQVLEHLGFVLKPGEAWQAPKAKLDDTKPLSDPTNIFLDNVEYELSALILSRPSPERLASQDTTTLEDAGKEFARALGCQAYDQVPSARTAGMLPADRTSPFIVLGVPANTSDDLINSAYDWQCSSCPEYAPTFLSALRDIALFRNSESLQVRLGLENSNGKVNAEELREAHAALGVPMTIPADADEAHIIGTFNARLQDSPAHEAQLREHLRVIGTGLRSRRILDYAARDISTYEQALEFLGAQPESDDDWIQPMYSVKLNENPALQDLARKAVKVIAMHRRSELLQEWITSGFSSGTVEDMDLGEAYRLMDIEDRTTDDPTVLSVYEIRKQEQPGSLDRLARALRAIAQDRNSRMLLAELDISAPPQSKASLEEPIGLDNIGNTCYLNSLLQSLFTIRAVREVVLDFDNYKMETTIENMASKKVGQRKISIKEVQTAQKFVQNLATLFQSMITSPRSAIKPEQELVRLTLETNSIEKRRRSTLAGGVRPNLGSIDDRLIQGPMPPPNWESNRITEEPLVLSSSETGNHSSTEPVKAPSPPSSPFDVDVDVSMAGNDDNSSEATLISRPSSEDHINLETVTMEQQQSILDNKENLAPTKATKREESPPSHSEPLRPASPSKINAQAGALANKLDQDQHITFDVGPPIYQPPPGPPPIPPRKPVETSMPTLEQYAQQQDVTEVFNHCVLQLSYAIKPTDFEVSGEQKDEIHDLFFGGSRLHTLSKEDSTQPVPFLNLMVNISHEPVDLYEALDSGFDLTDAGTDAKTFTSITKLPPILTIALGRVIWDEVTKARRKLENFVEMPEVLFMDRYLESSNDSDVMQKRARSWKIKQRLAEISKQKTYLEHEYAGSKDLASFYDDTRHALLFLQMKVSQDEEYGGPIPVDPALPDVFGDLASKARERLEAITIEIADLQSQLTNLFVDNRQHPYVLHAVFFHRGSHGSGHYWIYIKDHKTGIWRKYNDDRVTVVLDTKQILGKPDVSGGWSGPANAYFLVYIKANSETGSVEELVETVKRQVLPEDDDIVIEPLGGGGDYDMNTPSQMTEMPPTGHGFDIGASNWGSYTGESVGGRVEGRSDWDNSEAQVADPSAWYR